MENLEAHKLRIINKEETNKFRAKELVWKETIPIRSEDSEYGK